MRREPLIWGGAAVALAGLGVGVLAMVIASTATPEAHVERYLQALAADDLVTAARLAGLPEGSPTPLGDARTPSVLRIVDSAKREDGRVAVVAEYGRDRDAATVILTLARAEPLFGFVPQWRFTAPPVRTLEIGVNNHDEFLVNGLRLAASAAGETARVTAFVPALLEIGVVDPFVEASSVSFRLSRFAPNTVMLEATPTPRLERAVQQEVARFLASCVEQEVLQPGGCPFGREIDDRVLDRPQWKIVNDPVISLEPGGTPGAWEVRALAEIGLQVTVQRLFDGRISEVDTTLTAIVAGQVIVRDGVPRLMISPRAP